MKESVEAQEEHILWASLGKTYEPARDVNLITQKSRQKTM